jgi:hypothetical protein
MKTKLYTIAAIIITLTAAQATFADLKIKSKQSIGGQSYENTTYIKGKRQRTETMSGAMVNITQCDLRRAIQMNPAAKTFVVNEFGEIETTGSNPVNARKNVPVTKGGRIVTTITVKDTGERKQMFGFTARHLIITMDTQSSPDACNKTNSKMEMDGWYIDFEAGFDCDQSYTPRPHVKGGNGGCQDKYEMKTIGTAKRGYALYEKMRIFDESGKEAMSYVNEVVELSKTPLDAGLFEVPADYREVTDAAQMYAGAASASAGSSSARNSSVADSKPVSSGLSTSIASTVQNELPENSATIGPKKAGYVRIGIAAVKTGAIGEGVSAGDLARAIENTFSQFLKVPNVEVVAIEAKLQSAIESEARQKDCDYVIQATAAHKKGGGFGKMFGSTLGSAIARTGIGHTGSTAGNIAGQVATQSIVSATTVSASMKNKDELTLDLKLNSAAGATVLARSFKSKAKSDGDDIISALIEQAAQAVIDSIGK